MAEKEERIRSLEKNLKKVDTVEKKLHLDLCKELNKNQLLRLQVTKDM